MPNHILAIVATVGGIAGTIAYLPQIIHLIKIKNSSGLSLLAWSIWLFSNLSLLVYGISIKDIPVIITQTLCSSTNIITIILAIKYKKRGLNVNPNQMA